MRVGRLRDTERARCNKNARVLGGRKFVFLSRHWRILHLTSSTNRVIKHDGSVKGNYIKKHILRDSTAVWFGCLWLKEGKNVYVNYFTVLLKKETESVDVVTLAWIEDG